jgi:pyruvate/2-oxoglutarate/acetoin dehydrogenase E1 component
MPISWFMGVPGLKIVCPSTPRDAKGLLKQAIRDSNPVLFLEHKRLYPVTGETSDDAIPIGVAQKVREGNDITLVSAMKGVHDCLAAAEELAADGIEAEVIDLRTLRPLDMVTVIKSIRRTNRLLVVEEGPQTGGWAGEVLARTVEDALDDVDLAWRLTTPDTPIPYSHSLEDAFLPSSKSIVASVTSRLRPPT